MRILQIIDSLSVGGAEKLIVDTVPLLVKRGYIVDVVLLNGLESHLYRELKAMNCCTIFRLGDSFYNPFYILKLIPIMQKYDVVHVHLFPAQYFAAIARLFVFKKTRLIFTEHSTSNRRLEKTYFRGIEKVIYRIYNKVICITQEVKNVLHENLQINNQKLVVIENGINLSLIEKSIPLKRSEFSFSETDKLLIMVAGFRTEKDQDTVIRAITNLPKEYKLLLVGDGQRRNILKELVEELSIADRVFFLGVRNDVYGLLKMSDIAILSSHWEGFGLVAVEAMASGIPLIASNVHGLAQVVQGGGLLFERNNVDDLCAKILSLENVEQYKTFCNSGIAKAQIYSVNFMIDKLTHLYENV